MPDLTRKMAMFSGTRRSNALFWNSVAKLTVGRCLSDCPVARRQSKADRLKRETHLLYFCDGPRGILDAEREVVSGDMADDEHAVDRELDIMDRGALDLAVFALGRAELADDVDDRLVGQVRGPAQHRLGLAGVWVVLQDGLERVDLVAQDKEAQLGACA